MYPASVIITLKEIHLRRTPVSHTDASLGMREEGEARERAGVQIECFAVSSSMNFQAH